MNDSEETTLTEATPTSTPHAPRRRPTAVDLFAGAGGLSLGLEQAGFDVLSSVEYDPVHAMTHRFNFPLTDVLCGDISQLGAEELRSSVEAGWDLHHPDVTWDGEVDLVAGGPPCQGFSFAGKRRVDDERNDLIFHYFRLVTSLRPKYFVMENVPGIISGEHALLLEDLRAKFLHAGYVLANNEVLNAAHYGVPQDRRRFILIGSRVDVDPASHPIPTHRPASRARGTLAVPDSALPGPTVGMALAGLPNLDDFASLSDTDRVRLGEDQYAGMIAASSPYGRILAGVDGDITDLSHPRVWDPRELTSSWRTVHTAKSVARFEATEPGSVEPVSHFKRLHADGLCNTLRAGTGAEHGAHTAARPIHPEFPRVLSVREGARLHSYPDWFRLHSTKHHGFRQVGNSVPPLMGRAIGRAIISALGVTPARPSRPLALGDEAWLQVTTTTAKPLARAIDGHTPAARARKPKEAA